MAYSGGIISLPVRISDVKSAVNYNSNNFVTLVRNGNINKWAKYKPVRYATRGGLTDDNLKSVNYGIANIPTWNRLDYMCDFLFSDNKASLSSSRWPECDQSKGSLSNEYFEYQRPTGGSSSLYRMKDFNHYNRDAEEPIGEMQSNTINIEPVGTMRVPFKIGALTSYGLSLNDLSFPGSSSYSIKNMYFGVVMKQTSGSLTARTYAGTQKGVDGFITMQQAEEYGYWVDFLSDIVTAGFVGTWKIFPIISSQAFDNTYNISGIGGKLIAPLPDHTKAITVTINYAEVDIVNALGYRDPNSSNRYVRIVLDLKNNENVARSYKINVKLYNRQQIEQTEYAIYQTGRIGANTTDSITLTQNIAAIWVSMNGGWFSATCDIDISSEHIAFYRQSTWGMTQLSNNPPI